MINSKSIRERADKYITDREQQNRKPTLSGMSRALKVNRLTLYRLIKGEYAKDRACNSNKEHVSRTISNADIEYIKTALYGKG